MEEDNQNIVSDSFLHKKEITLRWLIFLGFFGAHDFYAHRTNKGLLKLILSLYSICALISAPFVIDTSPILFLILIITASFILNVVLIMLVIELIDISLNKYETGSKAGAIIYSILLGIFGAHDFYISKNYNCKRGLLKLVLDNIALLFIVIAFSTDLHYIFSISISISSIILSYLILETIIDFFRICLNKYDTKEVKWVAIVKTILVGTFGSHNFYLGQKKKGYAKIFVLAISFLFESIFIILAYEINVLELVYVSYAFAILGNLVLFILVGLDLCSILTYPITKLSNETVKNVPLETTNIVENKSEKPKKEKVINKEKIKPNALDIYNLVFLILAIVLLAIFALLIVINPLNLYIYSLSLIISSCIFAAIYFLVFAIIKRKITINKRILNGFAKAFVCLNAIVGVASGLTGICITELPNPIVEITDKEFYRVGDDLDDVYYVFYVTGFYDSYIDNEPSLAEGSYKVDEISNIKFYLVNGGKFIKFTGQRVLLDNKKQELYVGLDLGHYPYLYDFNNDILYSCIK